MVMDMKGARGAMVKAILIVWNVMGEGIMIAKHVMAQADLNTDVHNAMAKAS